MQNGNRKDEYKMDGPPIYSTDFSDKLTEKRKESFAIMENDNVHVKAEREHISWKQVWYDFSQNTTFHGLDKITGSTPFILRRYQF